MAQFLRLRHSLFAATRSEPPSSDSSKFPHRVLRRVHPGYLFDASEVEIDVDRFQALIVEGHHARDEGDLERTDHAFATAIGFYRGAYLEDEPQATWTLGPRERLERTYRDLLVATAGIATARG